MDHVRVKRKLAATFQNTKMNTFPDGGDIGAWKRYKSAILGSRLLKMFLKQPNGRSNKLNYQQFSNFFNKGFNKRNNFTKVSYILI